MSTKMLIDARHSEETRVTIVRGSRVEEFDYENIARKQLKGSIYLARVTRVEPSLQAAFVEYGGNRHGFLAFSEIHPDYYQIPLEDREEMLEEMTRAVEAMSLEEQAREAGEAMDEEDLDGDDDLSGDEGEDEKPRGRQRRSRRRPERSRRRGRGTQSDAEEESSSDTEETAEDSSADNAEDDTENADDTLVLTEVSETERADEAEMDIGLSTGQEIAPASDDTSDIDDANNSEAVAETPSQASPDESDEESGETDDEPASNDSDPDVIAEDTGADQEDEKVTEELPLDEQTQNIDPAEGTSSVEESASTAVDSDEEPTLEQIVEEALSADSVTASVETTRPTDEEKPKRRRTRRKKADDDAEEAPKKRRTRRRKKVEDVEETAPPAEPKPAEETASEDANATTAADDDANPTDQDDSKSETAIEAGTAENTASDSAEQTAADTDSVDDSAQPAAEVVTPKIDKATIEAIVRRRMLKAMRRRYAIQEVIKKRQILLVQVAKEERGNKGAALTTYISLAGRYCVLMPNSTHSGGVSRKISSVSDRRRLKGIIKDLNMPSDMGLIIRTAGMTRTKADIKRDYDYLLRLWNDIRELTLTSTAPALIYEEADLIRRSIRDMYTRDVEEILVEGERGYKAASSFMKLLVPNRANKVVHYNDRIPLFQRYQVETQLDSMFQPSVSMKSGGYVVINPTEALISIDVNSGRSTKEHNIEETALKTNLEAADEIARQLRLRDMAGLVVIDFIDMEDRSNIRAVEKRLRDAVKSDRARIQVGRISSFGLMEMSRQRLRPNLIEASTVECPHCKGTGFVLSLEAAAIMALRKLEEEGIRGRSSGLDIICNPDVAAYLLNNKRAELVELESRYGAKISVIGEIGRGASDIELQRAAGAPNLPTHENVVQASYELDQPDEQSTSSENDDEEFSADDENDESGRRRRRRRRRGGRRNRPDEDLNADEQDAEKSESNAASDEPRLEDDERPRKRRGRRGGRRRRGQAEDEQNTDTTTDGDSSGDAGDNSASGTMNKVEAPEEENSDETREMPSEKPRRRVRRRRKSEDEAVENAANVDTAIEQSPAANTEANSDHPPAEPVLEAPESNTPEGDIEEEAATAREASVDVTTEGDAQSESDGAAVAVTDDSAAPETNVDSAPLAADESEETPSTEATGEPQGPVSSHDIEVKLVSAQTEDKPKRRGWWGRRK